MWNTISKAMESPTFPCEDGTRIEEIADFYADLQPPDWEHPGSGTNQARQAELKAVQAAGTQDIIKAETN